MEPKHSATENMPTIGLEAKGFKLVSSDFFLENYAELDWHFVVKNAYELPPSMHTNLVIDVDVGWSLRSKKSVRAGNSIKDAASDCFNRYLNTEPKKPQRSWLTRYLYADRDAEDLQLRLDTLVHIKETIANIGPEFEKNLVESLVAGEVSVTTLRTSKGRTRINAKGVFKDIPKTILIPRTMPAVGDRWYVAGTGFDIANQEFEGSKITPYDISQVSFGRLAYGSAIAPIATFDVVARKVGAQEGDRHKEWSFSTPDSQKQNMLLLERRRQFQRTFFHSGDVAFRNLEDARFWLKEKAEDIAKTAESFVDIVPNRKTY